MEFVTKKDLTFEEVDFDIDSFIALYNQYLHECFYTLSPQINVDYGDDLNEDNCFKIYKDDCEAIIDDLTCKCEFFQEEEDFKDLLDFLLEKADKNYPYILIKYPDGN